MSDAESLHTNRRRADSFGDSAELYDRVRPPYPADMIDFLVMEQPLTALDVGCGTAIAARLLQARGVDVLGLEPDVRMAAVARAHGVVVEAGTFEGWNARSRRFDLLTAGQAWHWVDPHAGAAKAAQVLRPGGRIGLFWNQPQPEGLTGQAMDAAYAKWAPALGRQSVLLGQRKISLYEGMADAVRRSGRFEDVKLVAFEHHIAYSTEEWLALAVTHSDHHTLPADQLKALLDTLRLDLDALGGHLTMRYQTILVTGRASGGTHR